MLKINNNVPLPCAIKINGEIPTKVATNDNINKLPDQNLQKALDSLAIYNEQDVYEQARDAFIWSFLRQIMLEHHSVKE